MSIHDVLENMKDMDGKQKLSIHDFDEMLRDTKKGRPISYILDDDNNPVPVEDNDVISAAQWRRDHPDRWRLRQDEMFGCLISTVFLGYDHSHSLSGPPVLWETMIFEDYVRDPESWGEDIYLNRHTSHADAIVGHAEAVSWLIDEKSDLMTALKELVNE
jgi:hypothetical protein